MGLEASVSLPQLLTSSLFSILSAPVTSWILHLSNVAQSACLLAYRFWLSAKWHPNSVQLFCKGTLRSWAPFRCLVHCCTPSQSHFHLCRSCCGFGCLLLLLQACSQALHLCWPPRMDPTDPCMAPEQQQLQYFLARVAQSHPSPGVSLLGLHWGNTVLNGFVSLDLAASSWAM